MMRTIMAAALALPLLAKTPAELKISHAEAAIEKNPESAGGYSSLAMALAARARETADPAFYNRAMDSVTKALSLDPNDLGAQKAKIWTLLGMHRFAEAREAATSLNKVVPDDLQMYGFLVDSNIELGDYSAAEKAGQWMLDLRPGNVAGLTRGAYLRELFGDIDGASEFMKMAFDRIRPEEVEDRAWTLTQIGHLQFVKGHNDAAARVLENALKLFPDYHYALGKLAKVRLAQGRFEEAISLSRRHYELAPHPENLFEVAVALKKASRDEEARETFEKFEKAALREADSPDNSNRELISYYLDYARRFDEGLSLAKREFDLRKDIHTVGTYAWALYRIGRVNDAAREISSALGIGTKDPELLAHAAVIRAAKQSLSENERIHDPRETRDE